MDRVLDEVKRLTALLRDPPEARIAQVDGVDAAVYIGQQEVGDAPLYSIVPDQTEIEGVLTDGWKVMEWYFDGGDKDMPAGWQQSVQGNYSTPHEAANVAVSTYLVALCDKQAEVEPEPYE